MCCHGCPWSRCPRSSTGDRRRHVKAAIMQAVNVIGYFCSVTKTETPLNHVRAKSGHLPCNIPSLPPPKKLTQRDCDSLYNLEAQIIDYNGAGGRGEFWDYTSVACAAMEDQFVSLLQCGDNLSLPATICSFLVPICHGTFKRGEPPLLHCGRIL